MIRVLIADDHALVRQGLRQVVSLDKDIDVLGEAKTGWDVLDKLSKVKCDLVLLDMRMPGPSGVELIRRLKRDLPALHVLVLSMHAENEIVKRALQAGAAGYVTKDSEPETLLTAIHKVSQGGRYIDSTLAEKMVFNHASPEAEPHKQFSGREHQVFELLVAGKSSKEIAGKLNLSVKTVSTYKTRIMQKLGVTTDMEMLRYALHHEVAGK